VGMDDDRAWQVEMPSSKGGDGMAVALTASKPAGFAEVDLRRCPRETFDAV
jgi:hypothetical protein